MFLEPVKNAFSIFPSASLPNINYLLRSFI